MQRPDKENPIIEHSGKFGQIILGFSMSGCSNMDKRLGTQTIEHYSFLAFRY